MWQFASPMEIFQLLAALLGLGFAMWGVWIAFDDAMELADAAKSDLRRLVALSRMRGQLARVVVQGILVFIGVVSILLPPPAEGDADVSAELQQALMVRIGLVFVTVILTLDGIMERRQRMAFMARLSASIASGSEGRLSDQMTAKSIVDVQAVHDLKEAIQKGTDAAKSAYEEANSVNTKIAELNERLTEQAKE